MRQLLPEPVDPVDPRAVYGDLPSAPGRPGVRLNMIASIDGTTSVEGVSGGLGGPPDKRVFVVLRSLADVVLVAAGTLRAEHYGPAPIPIAVVTRSCQLDWDTPFFADAEARPLIITVDNAAEADRARAAQVADVVVAGDEHVDMHRALAALGERGFAHVLAEGGPTLNAQLAAAGLLDELCLTLSPKIVGGSGKRVISGNPLAAPLDVELRSVCEEGGYLFLRVGKAD